MLNREIKFRGRGREGVYTGHWLYGSLILATDMSKACISSIDYKHINVDPDTVGQFTGLYDCKKREIYEGDIVKVTSYGEESFHIVKYMIDLDYAAFDLDPVLDDGTCNSLSYCMCDYDTKILVIGNIYDNPELAEKCKRQVCD